jgi:hypothetical protein
MMRQAFLQDADVREFAEWLADRLTRLTVRLDMSISPYMPLGLKTVTTFDQLVPDCYRWRFTGMVSGDWLETMLRMRDLSVALRDAVDRDDVAATHVACEAIVEWGADRNSRVGASAYLVALGDRLPLYLRASGHALSLSEPDPSGTFRSIPRMNSTLCKIHSLYAADGLPIYESRVAAAVGTLVEMWRRDTGRAAQPLPPMLRFPAVGNQLQRRVRRAFPDAVDPGVLSYNLGSEIATAGRWAGAAVRVGLLMEETLRRSPSERFVAWTGRHGAHAPRARLAAFVGALFMAGYDPRCMVTTTVDA